MAISEEISSLLEAQKVEFEERENRLCERLTEEWRKERETWKEEREGPRRRVTPGGLAARVCTPEPVGRDEEAREYSPLIEHDDDEAHPPEAVERGFMGRILSKRFSGTNANTETMHMYAVAVTVSPDVHIIRKFANSLAALFFPCILYFALVLVIRESSFPKCNSMTDCASGTYCTNIKFDVPTSLPTYATSLPTCRDCSFAPSNSTEAEEVCPALFPSNKWKDWEIVDLDHNEFLVDANISSKLLNCVSFMHCSQTKKFVGKCDFINLNQKKVDGRTSAIFIFLVLLWALPISRDVEEAFTEEWVLDHHLAGSLNIPAEIVRVALRIRRCILPAFVTSATLVLMFTNDTSAKNIILNFLAITSITEMDNVLAALFLRPHHREMMEEAARDVKIDTGDSVGTVFLW
eukprot:CAMPEP_0194305830 /NCGR_PEP_ID=MMETSP0171-20130528/3168_1 /TAXON_ID=218684 /ORGANISM="Corethron pennatum, Strain L29A3" /LENGTH=406 /DNA_ID=CAMNT_0039057471 /DNA_START=46 /DNA_END=1263 /DNA_ORIENTATION=+